MEFYSAIPDARPVRLKEELRAWAWESMHGKYGDEAMKAWAVAVDDIPGIKEMNPLRQQDLMLKRIAERAPIRICEQELVSGAATLGLGIRHRIPATLNGKEVFRSVSHLTPNFKRSIDEGIVSYERELSERMKDNRLTGEEREFLESRVNVIESMRIWHGRYLEATKEKKPENYRLLERVPFEGARTFREAVQSLWFLFAFMRQCE